MGAGLTSGGRAAGVLLIALRAISKGRGSCCWGRGDSVLLIALRAISKGPAAFLHPGLLHCGACYMGLYRGLGAPITREITSK